MSVHYLYFPLLPQNYRIKNIKNNKNTNIKDYMHVVRYKQFVNHI